MDEAIKPKSKEDEGEYGYEGDMAMSQLRSIIRNSQQMLEVLDPKTDLPEWVQSKITLAKDYIETSANYLMSELEEATGPSFVMPGANLRKQSYRDTKARLAKVTGGGAPIKEPESKPQEPVVSRGKVFKEQTSQTSTRLPFLKDRRSPTPENQVRRAFIDARKKKKQAEQMSEGKKVHPSGRSSNETSGDTNKVDPRRAIHPSKGRYPMRAAPLSVTSGYLKDKDKLQIATKLSENYADMILEKKRKDRMKKANNVTNMDPELGSPSSALNTTPTMDASSSETGKQ